MGQDKYSDNISLETVLEQLPGNVYWKDLSGHYLGSNKNCADLFNLTPAQLIGSTDFDIMPSDMAKQLRINDRHVVLTNEKLIVEEEGIDSEGQCARYLSYKQPLIDKKGEIAGIIGTSLNIQSFKQKEKKLLEQKSILENSLEKVIEIMPGNVYWKNTDGQYLGCNKNLSDALGLDSPNDVIGKNVDELAHDIAAPIIEIDKQVMSSKKLLVIEEQAPSKHNKVATYLSHKLPLIDENNNVYGLLGVSIDISKQKKIENDLIQAKEKAEVASQEKSELLLNLSHDLRTPSANILGLAKLIQKNNTHPHNSSEINSIINSSENLLTLLDEILESAQLSDNKQELVNDYFNIQNLINESTNILKPNILKKGLHYSIDTSKIKQPELIGDKNKLLRIITNLINNAVKFTEHGEITLTAKQTILSEKECRIDISITDTGIGIPEDKIDKIFDKFYRLHPSFQGIYQGSGLGLYIVKRLVRLLNGTIDVTSKLNHGSSFHLHFNMHTIENRPENVAPTNNNTSTPPIKILIVEDNNIARFVTKNIFSEFNCTIDTASNGKEALLLQPENYHLIIMDIGLPDIDGYTLAQKIKQQANGTFPIINGLTAHATLEPSQKTSLNSLYNKPLSHKLAKSMLNDITDIRNTQK